MSPWHALRIISTHLLRGSASTVLLALLIGCMGCQSRVEEPSQAASSAAPVPPEAVEPRPEPDPAAPEDLETAALLDGLGVAAHRHGDLDPAEQYLARALALRERLAPESLVVATSLNNLAEVKRARGDLDHAEELYGRSLALRERLGFEDLGLALSLNGLGAVALARGDPDEAAAFFRRSLALRERLAPDSLDVGDSLNNLGIVARVRGDLAQAAEFYRRSLAIRERLAPDSLKVAQSLNNLGNLAWDQGDLDQAAELYQRSLAVNERLAPDSLRVAASLSNLGVVAQERRDLDRAAEFHRRALAIRERQAPDSLVVTTSLGNLGVVARARGDLDLATELSLRALAIQERLAPESPDAATTLVNLGELALARGDPDRAAAFCRRAVAIFARLAPESLDMARSLSAMGRLASARGAPDQATAAGRRALAIFEQLAPGSRDEAEVLELLAVVARRQGELDESLAFYLRSLDALEAQLGRLGGSERVKADFRARHGQKYRGAVEILLEENRGEEAFAVLERWRARSFLTLLAERDLGFGADVPRELDEARRRLAVLHDRVLHELMGSSPARKPEDVEALRQELQDLLRRYEDNAQAIRRASPRLAALRDPQPLDLHAAREVLDPGTVMLAYSVGEESSQVFVVRRDTDLRVATLAVSEEALRREVEIFRKLIRDGQFGVRREKRLLVAGERLYDLLIAPVADEVGRSRRILILPDGPLHLLPFGALVRRTDGRGEHRERHRRYLAEWKPLHSALSATVYAELVRSRRSPRAPCRQALVAFGDPDYPRALDSGNGEGAADVRVRSLAQRGFDWRPLPATRREVERVAELFRGDAATYLGSAATEERAKSLGPDVRYLHFATHSVLDERSPLDSALVLTVPEAFREDRDNGLLQVWEIFEQVRLDADLVVLSACDTGLGEELGGEGLIGLTRAFQYAGARSVVASLWAVDDRTTAELMARFYRHLLAGEPKDEALRAAKVELIREPIPVGEGEERKAFDASHPFYWAAFELMGDWR